MFEAYHSSGRLAGEHDRAGGVHPGAHADDADDGEVEALREALDWTGPYAAVSAIKASGCTELMGRLMQRLEALGPAAPPPAETREGYDDA